MLFSGRTSGGGGLEDSFSVRGELILRDVEQQAGSRIESNPKEGKKNKCRNKFVVNEEVYTNESALDTLECAGTRGGGGASFRDKAVS